MDAIENIALMAALMFVGAGLLFAMLAGFMYWMEVQGD